LGDAEDKVGSRTNRKMKILLELSPFEAGMILGALDIARSFGHKELELARLSGKVEEAIGMGRVVEVGEREEETLA
jgi:hypothetical protein